MGSMGNTHPLLCRFRLRQNIAIVPEARTQRVGVGTGEAVLFHKLGGLVVVVLKGVELGDQIRFARIERQVPYAGRSVVGGHTDHARVEPVQPVFDVPKRQAEASAIFCSCNKACKLLYTPPKTSSLPWSIPIFFTLISILTQNTTKNTRLCPRG